MNEPTSPAPAGIVARLGKREIGLLAALFCVAALILGFGLLAEEVMEGDTTAFDTRIAHFFRPIGGDGPYRTGVAPRDGPRRDSVG